LKLFSSFGNDRPASIWQLFVVERFLVSGLPYNYLTKQMYSNAGNVVTNLHAALISGPLAPLAL